MSFETRLWSKVDFSSDGCWLWTASTDRHGYGQFWLSGLYLRSHRVAYELLVGPIPAGLELDHLCRNRRCVRPDHLEPVQHAENVRRGRSPSLLADRHRAIAQCPAGHVYDEENTYVRPGGWRTCRACKRKRDSAYKRRRRATAPSSDLLAPKGILRAA